MKNSDSSKAYLSQDLYLVRGVAIVLVVIGHIIGYEKNSGLRQMYDTDIFILTDLCKFIYSFHMPVFFILSGIGTTLFSKKDISYTKFAKSKLSRIVVPLICYAPIFFILQSLSDRFHFSGIDIVHSVVYPYSIFWFFHALIFISTLSFICFKFSQGNLVYCLVSVALLLLSFFKGQVIYFYYHIFYAFGLIIASYLPQLRTNITKLPMIIIGLFVALSTAMMLAIHYLLGVKYLLIEKLINGIIGFILIYTIVASRPVSISDNAPDTFWKKIESSCLYLGKISMSIYLFHVWFGAATRMFLTKILSITDPSIHFVIGCTVSLLGPIVIYNFFQTRSKIFMFSIGEAK